MIVKTEEADGSVYGTYEIWYVVTVADGSATVTQKFSTLTIKDKCSADGGLTVTSVAPTYTAVLWFFNGLNYGISNADINVFTSSDNTNCPLTYSCLRMTGIVSTTFSGSDPCSYDERTAPD